MLLGLPALLPLVARSVPRTDQPRGGGRPNASRGRLNLPTQIQSFFLRPDAASQSSERLEKVMVLRDRGDSGGRGGDPAVLGQPFRATPSPGRQAPRQSADGRRRDAPDHPWSEEEGTPDGELVQMLAWAAARFARPT